MHRPAFLDTRDVIPLPHRLAILAEKKSLSRTVFDVGMNNGDDSAHYLSKGYRVIAIEANPILVRRARERFKTEISSGQMTIEPVGIWPHPGKVPLWINEQEMCSVRLITSGPAEEPCVATQSRSSVCRLTPY